LLAHRDARALITAHAGAVCVVLTVSGDESATRRTIDAVRMECARATGDASTSAGAGRSRSGVHGVRASFREAEQALAMGRRVLGPGRAVSFADLGLHRLLFAVSHQPELADFYQDTVGALVAYDERSGGDLMATLDAFFACHGSPTETSQRMHLHRNTVLYRLRRIEEIGSLSLDDHSTRLNLHLCLRIRDVLALGYGAQDERGSLRASRATIGDATVA
ncbi:MAG: PucR family transcriptional regulator, partial [Candidatus Dormibacteria bacterium]